MASVASQLSGTRNEEAGTGTESEDTSPKGVCIYCAIVTYKNDSRCQKKVRPPFLSARKKFVNPPPPPIHKSLTVSEHKEKSGY